MKAQWMESDVRPGVMVSAPLENGKYRVPCIIGYFADPGGKRDIDADWNIYGLTDMTDGLFMKFGDGSKKSLMEQMNNSGHVPINKALFKDASSNLRAVENRLELPVVTINNCGCGC